MHDLFILLIALLYQRMYESLYRNETMVIMRNFQFDTLRDTQITIA